MSVKTTTNAKIQPAKGKKTSPDVEVKCDYCHMTGHSRDKCFCLHGYPNWHKLFGKPKPKPKFQTSSSGKAHTAAQVSAPDSEITSLTNVNLTDASFNLSPVQCKHLMQMIQNSMSVTTPASPTVDNSTPAWYPPLAHSTQFLRYYISLSQLCSSCSVWSN